MTFKAESVRRLTRGAGVAILFCLPVMPVLAAELSGALQWSRRVELSTPVSGIVERVAVRPGQQVTKGAGLVYLDRRAFSAELNKAKAEVTRLKKALAEAGRELERSKELYDRTLLSNHDLELAKISYAAAKAEYAGARANLAQAQFNFEYSIVRAPFSALVVSVAAGEGQTVVSKLEAEPLVALAEAGRMIARVLATEDQLATVKVGDEAEVRLNGRTFTGQTVQIGLEPATSNGGVVRYAVDVAFEYEPDKETLRAGQRVQVELR